MDPTVLPDTFYVNDAPLTPSSGATIHALPNVKQLPPLVPQPTTTLTESWAKKFMPQGWLGDYLDWSCQTTHTSPTFQLAAGLSYAATEMAIRGWKLENTSYNYPAIWFVLLAGSGAGKGTAIRRMQSLIAATDSLLPNILRLPEGGREVRTISVQGSAEGVMWQMEQHEITDESGRRTPALLINEEFHTLFDLVRKAPAFQDVLLSTHDQIDIVTHQRSIQRGKDGGEHAEGRKGAIYSPCFSTLFVSTEAQLINALLQRHLTGGFAPRFMWLAPDEIRFWPVEPPRRDDLLKPVSERVSRWIERLSAPAFPNRIVHFPRSGPVFERHVRFAQRLFDDYKKHPNVELYTPRLANQTQVLACVIATIETLESLSPLRGNIVVEDTHYALAQSIAEIAEATAEKLPGITAPQDYRQGQALLHAIQEAERFGLPTLACAERYQRTYAATLVELKVLADMGMIVGIAVTSGKQGRPPTYWFATEHAPPDDATRNDGTGRPTLDLAEYERHVRGEILQRITPR